MNDEPQIKYLFEQLIAESKATQLALVRLDEKVGRLDEKTDVTASQIRRYADDVLRVKQWQNRYGPRIKALEAVVKCPVRDVHVAEDQLMQIHPPPPSREQPPPLRPPAASLHDWDEDTGQHVFAPEDAVRLKEMAERDRKDSSFWRSLPKDAATNAARIVATALVAAAFTYLATHQAPAAIPPSPHPPRVVASPAPPSP